MNINRQLAAILFADIAGYTAMMQENEQKALQKLNHFRADIDSIVPSFNGQIIQFYGDGCLLIFTSVLQAIKCAIELQVSLNKEPSVPVRIGAHQGDIVLESGNVYGDSVNIAARIESMSIPGAVLLSEKVQSELKNQPDIPLASLGQFEFKNVKNPIEVFAVKIDGFPVPKKSQITGKFKVQNIEKSIAVLAFENRSSDPEQEYFSDGIAEEIIYALSQLDNLKVAGRASSFSFKNTKTSIKEIAAQLNVETILEGSIRKAGNKVRISVQMVNAVDGFQIWTERFDRELEDIFAIQDEIAAKVVRKMELTLLGKEKHQPLISRKTENIKAYQLYLQGQGYLDQRDNMDAALSCFNKAIDIDPGFAHAYTGIAYAYFYKVVFGNYHPKACWPKAETAIEKAMTIDSSIPETHNMKGLIEFYYHHEWEKARQEYNKSLILQPKLADTYRIKAYFHSMLLENELAVENAEKAYQLEPLSFNNWLSLADIHFRVGNFEKAIKVYLTLLEKYPDNFTAKEMMGFTYYVSGNLDKARDIFQTQLRLPEMISLYSSARYIFALENGDMDTTVRYLEHLKKLSLQKWVPPSILSLMSFYLGNEKEASDFFRQAIEDNDPGVIYVNIDPLWNKFRSFPLVHDTLKNLGLSL